MPVGYLALDWRPEFVKTIERGKNFVFAAHNFKRNGGESSVGLGFYEGEAFVLFDEDQGRNRYAYELNDFFTEMLEDEEERDFSDEGDDYVTVIGSEGEETEDFDSMDFDDPDEVRAYYNDIAKRYWV